MRLRDFIDRVDFAVLDRVFQPIANRIHQWTGLWPPNLAELCVILSVLAMAYRYYYDHPPPYVWNLTTLFGIARQLIFPLFFGPFLIYPKHTKSTPNPRRYWGQPLRIGLLVIMIYFFFLIGLHGINPDNGPVNLWTMGMPAEDLTELGTYAYAVAAVLLWWAASFGSLQMPPRRTVRVGKGWSPSA